MVCYSWLCLQRVDIRTPPRKRIVPKTRRNPIGNFPTNRYCKFDSAHEMAWAFKFQEYAAFCFHIPENQATSMQRCLWVSQCFPPMPSGWLARVLLWILAGKDVFSNLPTPKWVKHWLFLVDIYPDRLNRALGSSSYQSRRWGVVLYKSDLNFETSCQKRHTSSLSFRSQCSPPGERHVYCWAFQWEIWLPQKISLPVIRPFTGNPLLSILPVCWISNSVFCLHCFISIY